MKKRISAALMSAVLCLALLCSTAFGASTPEPKITITQPEAGATTVEVKGTGLIPKADYNMCAIGVDGNLKALFNARTDDKGAFVASGIVTGTLASGQKVYVSVPNIDDEANPYTADVTVKSAPVGTFTITASAGSGGSISPDGSVTVTKGGSKTFTIAPNSSYSISDVTVDGSSVGAQSSYTFSNVTSNHTIHATFTYNGGGSGDNPGGGGGSGGGGGGGGGSSSTNSPKIEKNTGGTVKVSSDGKTVTITPKDGYRIKDVIINGESVGAVTKYVFEKASSKNTVEVIFEKIPDSETPDSTAPSFNDVTGHWAASAINFVVEKGLFNGTSSTTFSPNAPMTRSMLATVLYRLAGEPAASGGSSFADVQSGQWYSNAVAWAAQNGIVTGTGTGFSPNGNITREQLATMLYRYCAFVKGDTSVSKPLNFPDAGNVSTWASEAMQWAVGAGIINGTDTGALNPGGFATRAEVATMLMRFVNFLG